MMLAAMALCFAQTQKGVVKTRGRMVAGKLVPGTPLQGATVQVEGRQAVLAKDGSFSFPVTDGKFTIKSVTKQGYRLVDAEVCRQYSYSATPLQIVMEVPGQQLSDQLAKERALRRELERRMQQREDEIEAMSISFEEKNRLLLQVAQEREANEKIIKDMAQYYSTLDYDQLDAFQQQVSQCLERGDMERADSLLQSRGSMSNRISQVMDRKSVQAKEEEVLKKRQKLLDESRKGLRKEVELVAADCYNYYQRYLLSHQNDSAAHYLIVRTALDTDNVEWLCEAACFIEFYLADYNKALSYFRRMLKKSELLYGKEHPAVAKAYTGIGHQYLQMGKTDSVLPCFDEALKIRKNYFGAEHPMVANSLLNVGGYYFQKEQYDKALVYYSQALEIYSNASGENLEDKANCYNAIGACRMKLGDSSAIDDLKKALDINIRLHGEQHPDVAMIYMNMAILYAEVMGDNAQASEYYQKSLDIEKQIFGENHPRVARVYDNMAGNALIMNDYYKAMDYTDKALAINTRIYGSDNIALVTSYCNKGIVYLFNGEPDKAEKYLEKAVEITTQTKGDDDPALANIYFTLGGSYYNQGKNAEALDILRKALLVQQQWLDANDTNIVETHCFIAQMYIELHDTDKALEHYGHAIDILFENPDADPNWIDEIREKIEQIKNTDKTKNNKRKTKKTNKK